MDRWWDGDPTGNLALVDSSDPQMGVSVAVLGFHALAKRELDRLGTMTLVDARQVEEAYDRVDLGPVAKAVESATTDVLGPVVARGYAGLVVEDWRSRARAASGRLSRVLVAKGLSWPRAVARTSGVAGVPLSHLGRYATIVANPGLDPLSVSDAADRVLMEYASQRGQLELPGMVEISKDRMRMRAKSREREEVKNPEFEEQHARDALGQFAAMNEGGEAKERQAAEERKARRAKRLEKLNRLDRMKATEVQEEEQGDKSRSGEGGIVRTRRGQNVPIKRNVRRSGTPNRQVQRRGGGIDWDNMPVVDAKDVPPVGELDQPVWVDEPLYLVRTIHQIGMGPPGSAVQRIVGGDLAFQKNDAVRLAANIARTDPSKPAVSLVRFAAEGAAVMGKSPFRRESGNKTHHSVGFKVYTDGNLIDNLIVSQKPIEAPASIVGADPEKAGELNIYEAALEKADEGRQRIRLRKKEAPKDPEFEELHARNRLGQFASMEQEGEAAQEQRAARRAKRLQKLSRLEKIKEAERETQAQAESQVERRGQREATVQRRVRRQGQVQRRITRRERQNPGDPLSAWHEFVKEGMHNESALVRGLGGDMLAKIGFGARDLNDPDAVQGRRLEPTFFQQLDEGLSVSLDAALGARAYENDVTNWTMQQIKGRYDWMGAEKFPSDVSYLFEPPDDEQLVYISNAYDMAARLSGGDRTLWDSADSALNAPVKDTANTVLQTALEEMHRSFGKYTKNQRANFELKHYSEVEMESGYFYAPKGHRRQIMRDPSHSPGPEPQLFVSNDLKHMGGDPAEHKYVAIVHPKKAAVLDLIADVTNPKHDPITETKRVTAAHALIKQYEPATGKTNIPLAELISAALQQEDIKAVQLDEETKLDLVTEQLRGAKYPAVRLDNIDVLRIY